MSSKFSPGEFEMTIMNAELEMIKMGINHNRLIEILREVNHDGR